MMSIGEIIEDYQCRIKGYELHIDDLIEPDWPKTRNYTQIWRYTDKVEMCKQFIKELESL